MKKVVLLALLMAQAVFAEIQIQPGTSVIVNENQKTKIVCSGIHAGAVNCRLGRSTDGRLAIFNLKGEIIYVPFNGNSEATQAKAEELLQQGICRF